MMGSVNVPCLENQKRAHHNDKVQALSTFLGPRISRCRVSPRLDHGTRAKTGSEGQRASMLVPLGPGSAGSVPGFEWSPGCPELDTLRKANQRWLRNSEAFFAYQRPIEFTLNGPHLQFPSPIKSRYQENNTVYADYFYCTRACGRAVLVLPHWNAAPSPYATFCRLLNLHGLSALLVTLPYHSDRKPRECINAEYAVSPNIGRTMASARQGIIDTLCCVDWLAQQG
jgi:hypothetical protein